MTTPLEQWSGEFGDEYTERNEGLGTLPARQEMFRQILGAKNSHTFVSGKRILEVGCNVGLNLIALRNLRPDSILVGNEPNLQASKRALAVADSWLNDLSSGKCQYDLVFTCGVLIHVPPENLLNLCSAIHNLSNRYILSIEYFSAEPEEKEYRGKQGLLWKRDFGEFWLTHFKLNCVKHGFLWKPATGLDNLHWWLMEKPQ